MPFDPGYSESDFRTSVQQGFDVQELFAKRLREWGFENVVVADQTIVDRDDLTQEILDAFGKDDRDVIVTGPNGKPIYIEVKGDWSSWADDRGCAFNKYTDLDTYPNHHRGVLVERCDKMEKKSIKPWMYVRASAERINGSVHINGTIWIPWPFIPGEQRRIDEQPDTRRGIVDPCWFTTKSQCFDEDCGVLALRCMCGY